LEALGHLVGPEGDDDQRVEGALEDFGLDGRVGDVDREDAAAAEAALLRLRGLLLGGGREGAEVDASGES
jgi:hypothetical protein